MRSLCGPSVAAMNVCHFGTQDEELTASADGLVFDAVYLGHLQCDSRLSRFCTLEAFEEGHSRVWLARWGAIRIHLCSRLPGIDAQRGTACLNVGSHSKVGPQQGASSWERVAVHSCSCQCLRSKTRPVGLRSGQLLL